MSSSLRPCPLIHMGWKSRTNESLVSRLSIRVTDWKDISVNAAHMHDIETSYPRTRRLLKRRISVLRVTKPFSASQFTSPVLISHLAPAHPFERLRRSFGPPLSPQHMPSTFGRIKRTQVESNHGLLDFTQLLYLLSHRSCRTLRGYHLGLTDRK